MLITKKLRRYADNRGFLVENTDPDIITGSKHFLYTATTPGIIRGNHYHEHKIEWFCIIKGKCRFVTEDITTKQREETIITDTDDIVFRTEPLVAHAMENVGDTEMIFLGFVNEVLDHNKLDTFTYKVI
ncbi:MAG: putative NAD dependent epimerase/dehydratase, possibly involved in polysaccharide biosynthesis [uncultured bacterium]|nr:MAG: putative NAD dependent epimerase/dehydratase, possibly involved in polysaccharide biosynthesis [uncultured bacterium]